AKPAQARDLFDRANQCRKTTLATGILIVIHVLPDQHDLAGARIHRHPALLEDLRHRHVALAAAHPRHDAESAVVVAPLNHAHKVADARASGDGQRLALRVVVARLEARDEVVVLADGHDRVEVWESPPEAFPFLGDDAASDRNRPLRRLPGLELMELRIDAIL